MARISRTHRIDYPRRSKHRPREKKLVSVLQSRTSHSAYYTAGMADSPMTDLLINNGQKITARQWQLAISNEWLAPDQSAYASRQLFATNFTNATVQFFKDTICTPSDAKGVISQLSSTLKRCDELTFDGSPAAFAYLLWHQVDRYHRVTQALDRLFSYGRLPLAKSGRPVRVLEVGSGPAPASYAVGDYYAALAAWAESRSDDFRISSLTASHTLDRGKAWQRIVHGLSEELLTANDPASRNRFFGITYPEFEGFIPSRLHADARESMKRRLLNDEDDWPYDHSSYFSIDQQAAQSAPPSAYDLIIVSNFVTNDSMLVSLKAELENLADSLVPGGVLLTLSGSNRQYQELWKEYATWPKVRRLDHVLDEVIPAHRDPAVQLRVARSTIDLLVHLTALDPHELDIEILPNDIAKAMRGVLTDPPSSAVRHVTYPRFQLHAFSRGNRAIRPKERKKLDRRNLAKFQSNGS